MTDLYIKVSNRFRAMRICKCVNNLSNKINNLTFIANLK